MRVAVTYKESKRLRTFPEQTMGTAGTLHMTHEPPSQRVLAGYQPFGPLSQGALDTSETSGLLTAWVRPFSSVS